MGHGEGGWKMGRPDETRGPDSAWGGPMCMGRINEAGEGRMEREDRMGIGEATWGFRRPDGEGREDRRGEKTSLLQNFCSHCVPN